MTVTLVTAGLCGLLFFILSFRVTQVRRSAKVSLGDGGDDALLSRIRAQANFAEYVPIILILIGLIETRVEDSGWLTAAGWLIFLARIAHAIGMARPAPNPFRIAGTAGTWTVLVCLSVWAVVLAYS